MKQFKMTLPDGFASALGRRHNGAKHTKKEIKETEKHLNHLYKGYCRNRDRYNWLMDVFWEEENIEAYFMTRKWYNAHKRRKRCEDNMLKFHRYMFSVLTSFDGNSGQEFNRYGVICPAEIMGDFKRKYLK